MFELLIDGIVYGIYAAAEDAEAARAGLRRWASTSTRIEVGAVASEPVPLAAPAPCAGCGGTGSAVRLLWVGSRGGWVHGPGECRACRESGVAEEVVAAIAA